MIEIVAAHGRFNVDDLGRIVGKRPRAYAQVASVDVPEYVRWLQSNGLDVASTEDIDRLRVLFRDGSVREPTPRARQRLLQAQVAF